MEVFIITQVAGCDGEIDILAVCSTKEKAENIISELIKELPFLAVDFDIEQFEIDSYKVPDYFAKKRLLEKKELFGTAMKYKG